MKRTMATLVGVALLGVVAGRACAQSAEEQAEYRRYCAGDYTRFCSAYDPSSQEVAQCFRQNMSRLSAGCRATIAKYQSGRPQRSR